MQLRTPFVVIGDGPVCLGSVRRLLAVASAGRFEPALMYRFDYRLADADEWMTLISSYSRITIDGLESYRYYEFRAAYIGRGVDSTPRFSETITTIIL